MVDSGGYTMKWRRVKPKPWEVRRKSTVLGLGHENSSSVWYCAAGESGKLLQSGDSFYNMTKEEKRTEIKMFYFHFYTDSKSDFFFFFCEIFEIESVNTGKHQF